jgi:hypothetical protein
MINPFPFVLVGRIELRISQQRLAIIRRLHVCTWYVGKAGDNSSVTGMNARLPERFSTFHSMFLNFGMRPPTASAMFA